MAMDVGSGFIQFRIHSVDRAFLIEGMWGRSCASMGAKASSTMMNAIYSMDAVRVRDKQAHQGFKGFA